MGCCPLGLDFDCTTVAGGVMMEAAPRILLRRGDKAAFNGIAMDVANDAGSLVLTVDVAIVIPDLPELFRSLLRSLEDSCFSDFRNWATRIAGGSFMSRWRCSGIMT